MAIFSLSTFFHSFPVLLLYHISLPNLHDSIQGIIIHKALYVPSEFNTSHRFLAHSSFCIDTCFPPSLETYHFQHLFPTHTDFQHTFLVILSFLFFLVLHFFSLIFSIIPCDSHCKHQMYKSTPIQKTNLFI